MNRGGRGRQPMPPIPEHNQPDFTDIRRRADEFARQAYPDVFARFERLRSGLDVNIPIVSAIIEREYGGGKKNLFQNPWETDRYSLSLGTPAISGGGVNVYEHAYDT